VNITSTNQFPIQTPQPPTSWADPSGSIDGPSADDLATGLSPDALMAYCQSRLDSIDGQVKDSFASQQRTASTISTINAFADILHRNDGDVTGAPNCQALESQFQTMITTVQSTDPNCAALPAMIQAYNSMVWSGDGGAAFLHQTSGPDMIDADKYPPSKDSPQGDKTLGNAEVQGYMSTLTDASSNLNSGSELQMVQLQSLMSQRQTAISLTTNLVQSLGDQESKIADNIGH
jgi:hypothetical protein